MPVTNPSLELPMNGSELAMIRWLFTYNDWTRPQTIAAVSRLTEEQLRQPGVIAGGLEDGSVFATLVHIVDVEESWLCRWMGTPDDPAPDPVKYADLASTAKQWEIVNGIRDAWLASLTGADLAAPFREKTGADGVVATYPLWPALIHVLIHTGHHRAEIYEALTRFGVPPEIEPDLLNYCTETLGVLEPVTSRFLNV